MNRYTNYKVIIAVLSVIIILQGIFLVSFLLKRPKIKAVPAAVRPKIAIVLDDWGYNLNNLHFLNEITYPLTISILPNLSYSSLIAREANNKGLEIILHLPLEPTPSEVMRLERNTILSNMDAEQIKDIFLGDINSIASARGVSNHMGSKLTSDLAAMEVIFREMHKKNLYFLDSMVSKKSVCEKLARKIGVKFTKRDIFLDNENNPAYIKGQINKLKLRALSLGYAIGIGHDRRITLEVLKEVMPQLEKEGFQFVFVSQLLK